MTQFKQRQRLQAKCILFLLVLIANAVWQTETYETLASTSPASIVVVSETFSQNQGPQHETSARRRQRDHKEKDDAGDESKGKQQPAANQPPFDLTTLLEFGGNPIGSAIKIALPGTLGGLNSDLSNVYSMMANGGQSQFKNLQSNYNGYLNGANNQYQKATSNVMQTYANGDGMMRNIYAILSNPQQFCQNLAYQSQQAMDMAQNQINQGASMSDNFLNRLQQSQLMQQQQFPSSLNQASQAGSSLMKTFGFGK